MNAPGLADTFSILAFGDSLTQGYPEVPDPVYGARIGGYEPPLESKFTQNTKHTAFVYNWGVGGELTSGGVGRIDSILRSRTAQFILIMEGTNDSNHAVSTETVKSNLGFMIDKARARGVEPILATIPPKSTPYVNNVGPYNTAIMQLASEKDVRLTDQYTALLNPDDVDLDDAYGSGDGLHLNSAGYDKMADTWLATLRTSPLVGFNIAPILQLLLN